MEKGTPEMPLLLVRGEPVLQPEFVDRQRAVVQRQAVCRQRPGLLPGWCLRFRLTSLDAGYVPATALRDLVACAGHFIGLGDFRPDYGRFQVVKAEEVRP